MMPTQRKIDGLGSICGREEVCDIGGCQMRNRGDRARTVPMVVSTLVQIGGTSFGE